MENVLGAVNKVLQGLLNLNSAVLIPFLLLILAVIMGEKISRAIRSALVVGVGFVGIGVLINLFFTELAPVAEAMVLRWGLNLNIIDVGWGPFMGAIWASKPALVMLPLFFLLNFLLLFIKYTNTLDIDIWNYALCFYAGQLTYVATGNNMVLCLIAFTVSVLITLKLADLTAPTMQKYFPGLEGISFPHTVSLAFTPIGYVLAKLLDKIPVIKNLDADPEAIRKKFGVVGEPVFMGFVIGFIVGIAAGIEISAILYLSITMAGVMLLLPRMVAILVEGLTPLTGAIRNRLQKWMPNRTINIGLDTAVLIGNPSTLAAGIILIPLALVLAAVLPYNRVVPFADLSSITFAICMITPFVKGNVVKLFIIGVFIIAFVMLPLSTIVAPEITQVVREANMFDVPESFGSATTVTSFLDGANPITFVVYKLTSLFGAVK
ncbi:MAG: PTS galactitol transporter subunit IIC [Treponema sp.]|jgi:PTS system galactitol-specific IIC component|nr:PTS galactitol transporter subunit IIC [Treponema sp.]